MQHVAGKSSVAAVQMACSETRWRSMVLLARASGLP